MILTRRDFIPAKTIKSYFVGATDIYEHHTFQRAHICFHGRVEQIAWDTIGERIRQVVARDIIHNP